MAYKIFVDGQEGTTGLKINERLHGRNDIELLKIDPEKRKDARERKKLINESDITFLCLPDEAAIEAVSLVENSNTRLIDASTAHRTNESWAYGFPELGSEYRENKEISPCLGTRMLCHRVYRAHVSFSQGRHCSKRLPRYVPCRVRAIAAAEKTHQRAMFCRSVR